MYIEHGKSVIPIVLNLLEIKSTPVPPHSVAESAQKLDDLLRWGQPRNAKKKGKRYLDDFHRFLLHVLGPCKLRSLLWFTRTEQGLETLLNIVHQVFGSIGIIQEILADDEPDGLRVGSEGESFGGMMAGVTRIDRRSR